jgi:NAD-dependent deacetylase
MKKHIVVLTGAGVSQESGINTFRDADGLWEGHDVQEVATPEGFAKNPDLVQTFYNQRRAQLHSVQPNEAHKALVRLERKYQVSIITQNVDDLHERAGSTTVIHLHGQLRKVRSTQHEELVYDWDKDLNTGDLCERGHQLRPHIVWFGEAVPMLEKAAAITSTADIVIIIGTSMQVYPAASLVGFAPEGFPIYYIDPQPTLNHELQMAQSVEIIQEKAGKGVRDLVEKLLV